MQFTFGIFDIVVFIGFIVAVMSLSLFKSRSEKDSEDYFLAGRGLSWWLVGFSLIAANISTEQFVGMSGNAASHVGLAIASYEWMAAITLVIVGFGFLPYFLRAGIYTMPEFLEYRYNSTARTIMAVATIFIYILLVGSVTYSGALTIRTLAGKMGYNVDLITGSIFIGLFAMIYVTAGGLKACAWADLIQGSALILGGTVIMFFAFHKLGLVTEAATIVNTDTGAITTNTLAANSGALERFWSLNSPRMNMFLPKTDAVLPWTALLLGLWIPNFYYWGLNQYITQRTLGSASLAQGQKGIVFAAFLKLLIPFVIVIPGIIAFNLFSHEMQKESISDNAPVIAKYYKANPNSQYIQVVTEPTEEAVANWPAGNFMLAIYPNSSTLKQVKIQNPFVLPLEQKTFEQLSVREYSVFETEDKASQHLFPAFVEEVKAFNAGIKESAKTANKTVTTERFIAYKYDTAMAQLLGNVLPQKVGLVGFVLAALLGAVVSSLAAMLNAASTIFTMDLFKKYIVPQASQKLTVLTGRICVVVFALFAVILAPQLGNPKISNSIFTIIQESQGFISPGILAVFVFGLIIRRAPASAGVVGLVTNIVVYGAMKLLFPEIQFLNRMAICFALCLVIMAGITILKPLSQPVVFKQKIGINLESSSRAKLYGLIVIILTLLLYFIFSPWGLI
ncbi:sodium/solute symporter [candidate division KSB1 bacterium]|nr:sodium/solute symporter [candidate division KSB1 bacterium]